MTSYVYEDHSYTRNDIISHIHDMSFLISRIYNISFLRGEGFGVLQCVHICMKIIHIWSFEMVSFLVYMTYYFSNTWHDVICVWRSFIHEKWYHFSYTWHVIWYHFSYMNAEIICSYMWHDTLIYHIWIGRVTQIDESCHVCMLRI